MFGASGLARQLAAVRGGGDAGAPTPDETLVEIPALGLHFLARTADGRMMFTPLADHPQFGLSRRQAMPAEAVLQSLLPFAKTVATDAPM
jgi:hypothetical protein